MKSTVWFSQASTSCQLVSFPVTLTSSGRGFNASQHAKKRVWPHKTSYYCTIPIAIPLKGYSNNIVIPFKNWSTRYASILALSESYWIVLVEWYTMAIEMLCNK